ncbi:hypothetical protein Lser_V15G12494 [Lactuca serriola]
MAEVVAVSPEVVVVRNKQVIFKDYVNGYPKESDIQRLCEWIPKE